MGQRLVIVSSPLVGCVSITPFRLRSVASELSVSESWFFLLLWICRCITVGSSGAVPRGNLRFPWGLGLPVLSMDWFLIDFFPVFPRGVFSPGVCRGSLSQVSTSPVWSAGCFWLLEAGSRPVGPLPSLASTSFSRFVIFWRLYGASWSPPLFPLSLRRALAYGLEVWPLPHYRWSRVHGRASAGLIWGVSALWVTVLGATVPVGWLRVVFPCFDHLPYF